MATEKYAACAKQFIRFHLTANRKAAWLKRINLKLAQIIYVVVHGLFKYLVFHVRGGCVFTIEDYDWFFRFSLDYFQKRFEAERNVFGDLDRILTAKVKSLKEPLVFKLS